MLHDLRFGVRVLLKQPGVSLIAVLTLALGIGATSAVFSLIQGVLLTPPPYPKARELVLVTTGRQQGWAAAQWMDWQKQAKSFESVAGYGWSFSFLVQSDGSESLEGMVVTADYFRVTQLRPVLGRTFLESESGATPAQVVMLGYEVWQRKFHGDPNIVGKGIRMSRRDTPVTVVGVMPPGVRFLPTPAVAMEPNYNVNATVDFWIPAGINPERLNNPVWEVVARLRDGVGSEQAQAELRILAERQAQSERALVGVALQVQYLVDDMNRDGRRILLPLIGAAGLVLLIACGNVAALLLVRGLQRQQEYAVRSALGVGRLALFRQISIESLLLALAGSGIGIGVALVAVKVFKRIGGQAIPRLDAVSTGWPVLACGLGSAVFASLLAGLLPALRASRLDPMDVLKSAGPKSTAGRGERQLLRAVTTVQTALTLALLVGAGLLIRTMMNLADVQSRYRTDRILTMSVTAVQGDWSNFHQRALEQVGALPGVQQAAFAWGVPLTGNSWPGRVEIEGQPETGNPNDRPSMPLRSVTTGYFKLLGLEITAGRDIRSTDGRSAPAVAVVNQAMAERYFARGNAIGKKFWLGGRQRPATEIVGIVQNGRTGDLTQMPEPEIYLSLWQASAFSKHMVVRTAGDPRQIVAAVQRELRTIDPTVSVENVKTLEQIRGESLASRNFAMQLLAGFALIGSVLTLVGIYGVLSLSVASRRREIAIRAAIGAGQGDIRSLVFAEGFRLVAGGIVAGVVAAVGLSRVLRTFLFGVEPADPLTLLCVVAAFAGVALLACWAPTRRATSIDPLEALRYE